MFKSILLVAVALLFVHVKSQNTDSDSTCNSQPSCQCNYGLSDIPPLTVGGLDRPNIAQGKPGRRGPFGQPGPKGSKGERGQAEDTSEELMRIQTQLESQERMIQEQADNTSEELMRIQAQLVSQERMIQELRDKFLFIETCDDLNNTSNRTSGVYTIAPSAFLPFRVYCNFTNDNVETMIHHNFPNEVDAGSCESARCAKHQVSYAVTLPQIISLIEQSAECRQLVKYRCIGSILFSSSNYAAWLSRDGTPQIYWGGATSRRNGYCACGETNSCVDNGYKCNCDRNTNDETSDEGYLTDKNKLPVTGLHFGDLGDSSEHGWFTLGPLICSGRAN